MIINAMQPVWWKLSSYCCSWCSCICLFAAAAPLPDSRSFICGTFLANKVSYAGQAHLQIKYEEDGKYPAATLSVRKHIFLSNHSLNFANSFQPSQFSHSIKTFSDMIFVKKLTRPEFLGPKYYPKSA